MMAIPNEELMAKAREAKSAEELLALAKENDVELTEEEANAYFEQMNKTGELSDDELDSVAGGGCHKKDGRLVVLPTFGICKYWTCKKCGKSTIDEYGIHNSWPPCGFNDIRCCSNCKWCSYEKGLWLCNEPRNRK